MFTTDSQPHWPLIGCWRWAFLTKVPWGSSVNVQTSGSLKETLERTKILEVKKINKQKINVYIMNYSLWHFLIHFIYHWLKTADTSVTFPHVFLQSPLIYLKLLTFCPLVCPSKGRFCFEGSVLGVGVTLTDRSSSGHPVTDEEDASGRGAGGGEWGGERAEVELLILIR